jgi:D-glycero-beta-D-manno-heptose-7-phosphate kinase
MVRIPHLVMDKTTERLFSLVDGFRGRRVVVWGDLILDEYVFGTTRRISREAPVLILSYRSRAYTLGGAGNALNNLRALGAVPVPVAVVGDDEAGRLILNLLKSQRIGTSFVFREKDYPTPLKTRILAGEANTRNQQILRIDREGRVPDTPALKSRLRRGLERSLKGSDALLVSDYNYFTVKEGLFHSVAARQRRRMPVAVDSRFRLLAFKGATIATPNEPEVEDALRTKLETGTASLHATGRALLRRLGAAAVLITRGARGMALYERGRKPVLIPAHGPSDIVDVTGAGDTVISVFTLAVAAGATSREAAFLANRAGSVVVMKKGAATLTPLELKQAIVS